MKSTQRRRIRRHAQNKRMNVIQYQIAKLFDGKHLDSVLISGYFRSYFISLPIDIEQLCVSYIPSQVMIINETNPYVNVDETLYNSIVSFKVMRRISCYNYVYVHLNDSFWNELQTIQQRLIWHHIKTLQTHYGYKTIHITIDTLKHYNTVLLHIGHVLNKQMFGLNRIKLKLSNIGLNDDDVYQLCDLITNISKYHCQNHKFKKQKKLKNPKVKKFFLQILVIDLSYNNGITDKCIDSLIQTIKKYLPLMKMLNLKKTNITKLAIENIMKYNVNHLTINISQCDKIKLKSLQLYHVKGIKYNNIKLKYDTKKKLENVSRQYYQKQMAFRETTLQKKQKAITCSKIIFGRIICEAMDNILCIWVKAIH
eukprot:443412_1